MTRAEFQQDQARIVRAVNLWRRCREHPERLWAEAGADGFTEEVFWYCLARSLEVDEFEFVRMFASVYEVRNDA